MTEAAAKKISRLSSGTVTPVMRRAVLLHVSPPPTTEMADSLFGYLKAEWNRVSLQYKEIVATASGVSCGDLRFDDHDEVRLCLEGKTRVIDFPRLSFQGHGFRAFDTRITLAICTEEDKMSSKAWSRLGLPLGSRPSVKVEKLSELTVWFRQIATPTAEWAMALLRRTVRERFPALKMRRHGCLEVSAMGARDKVLQPVFQRLSQTGATAEELLQDRETEERFLRYFGNATKFPARRLRDVTKKDPDSFWFSSPVSVELTDGELGVREVLYLLRPTPDAVEALGLAYDDSVAGDLASKSAVKVARWMANRS